MDLEEHIPQRLLGPVPRVKSIKII
ncbi:hypothetical protein NC653_000864 [Populus alba x Populus x berolinensis]|uniref:Uncharacterized protein n=1 Tax=Populus alba x Populus x berolinensis TaxID=444605 RepID=A0AAD6WFU9_9ROSI|nr:hypothetical protein NC653_000864 [Populus alba x Populus x berolinensis]